MATLILTQRLKLPLCLYSKKEKLFVQIVIVPNFALFTFAIYLIALQFGKPSSGN